MKKARIKGSNDPFMEIKGIVLDVGIQTPGMKPLILSLDEVEFEQETIIQADTTFDTFWQLYDKRVGKQKCIKLWGRLTLAEQAACMAYIPLYKQAQPDKQFRKNPETFLRNKSWNDEIIFNNNADRQPTIQQQRAAKLADILAG